MKTLSQMKSKLFKEYYIGISIHKIELAYCGSSDLPANLQGIDFETRSQINNMVARHVSIIAEDVVNVGQYYCLQFPLHEICENTGFH